MNNLDCLTKLRFLKFLSMHWPCRQKLSLFKSVESENIPTFFIETTFLLLLHLQDKMSVISRNQ